MVSLIPTTVLGASERIYRPCSPNKNCEVWLGNGIYNRFTSPGSTIYTKMTKKDYDGGGYSTATIAHGGGGSEIGSTIDAYSAYLYDYGEWVQVHYYNASSGSTYASMGDANVSSSNKMLANVQ